MVVTVMSVVPAALPVTTPSAVTAAISVLPLSHLTALFAAFAGETAAVSLTVESTDSVREVTLILLKAPLLMDVIK
jgi:hypothetical protein